MLKNVVFLLLVCFSLTACTFHQTPYITYEENVDIAETAVFSALDETSTHYNDTRVFGVDGVQPSCAQVGCPYWVRVIPGKHVFHVRYTSDPHWNYMSSGFNYANLEVVLEDMKPRHVYVMRFSRNGDEIGYRVEDLGENPEYGIMLGLKGANQKYHRVQF